ncbi:hypothetical protein [Cardinium endosymbiont of Nabis limbatus]|uniref:hypothetical protein n=1 Tax=Cardinium endosymbiont of Nabis limbatus TaxID=3066217 RepID=UPI003AF38D51
MNKYIVRILKKIGNKQGLPMILLLGILLPAKTCSENTFRRYNLVKNGLKKTYVQTCRVLGKRKSYDDINKLREEVDRLLSQKKRLSDWISSQNVMLCIKNCELELLNKIIDNLDEKKKHKWLNKSHKVDDICIGPGFIDEDNDLLAGPLGYAYALKIKNPSSRITKICEFLLKNEHVEINNVVCLVSYDVYQCCYGTTAYGGTLCHNNTADLEKKLSLLEWVLSVAINYRSSERIDSELCNIISDLLPIVKDSITKYTIAKYNNGGLLMPPLHFVKGLGLMKIFKKFVQYCEPEELVTVLHTIADIDYNTKAYYKVCENYSPNDNKPPFYEEQGSYKDKQMLKKHEDQYGEVFKIVFDQIFSSKNQLSVKCLFKKDDHGLSVFARSYIKPGPNRNAIRKLFLPDRSKYEPVSLVQFKAILTESKSYLNKDYWDKIAQEIQTLSKTRKISGDYAKQLKEVLKEVRIR